MRMDKLTSRFQQALADAQSLAVGRDHQFMEPAHVMLALLDQQGGGVRPLLLKAGVNVNKLRSALAFFAPELDKLHYGEEMWALFEAGELRSDSPLTGVFHFSNHEADVGAVLMSIEDARQEAVIRQQGREAAENADK